MRIVLNIGSALKPRPTGIARYVESLVPALLGAAGGSAGARWGEPEFVLGVRPHRWSGRRYSALARRERRRVRPLVAPYRLTLGRVALLHSLGAWLPTRTVSFRTVVTVHDLHTIDRPDLVGPERAQRRSAKIAGSVARADAVVTPSEFTRERVISSFDLDPGRVFAIHHGVDEWRARVGSSPVTTSRLVVGGRELSRPFLLGTAQAPLRKRGDRAIQAWEGSRAREAFDLVLFGGKGEACPILGAVRARCREPERVHLPGYVSDAALVELYRRAAGCLFTHEYEGFGLPLLEALAAGRACAATDIPAFREILGSSGAAELFPVDSIESAAAAIDRVVDGDLRRELEARALTRAADFSWATAARKTLEVYESLLGESLLGADEPNGGVVLP